MLSNIAALVIEWLLSKAGAFLLLWGKKEVAGIEQQKKEDDAVKELKDAKSLQDSEAAESKLLNG